MRTFFYRYCRRRQDDMFTVSTDGHFRTTILVRTAGSLVVDTQSGFRVRVVVYRAVKRNGL